MSLIDLWNQRRDEISGKTLPQIIAFAGEGQLADGNSASAEFRAFLKIIPSETLETYARYCLENSFSDSGLALQDVANEVGARLGFSVEHGRYRGARNLLGFDGIWRSVDGTALVIEVKTTDAYRIDLETVARYRERLIESVQIPKERSSILVVVGREDTGGLEAQIRGSKHAWDIRLISVDSLLRLVGIKEDVENPDVLAKIVGILAPQEFTRVDTIVDLVFGTTKDIKEADIGAAGDVDTAGRAGRSTGKKFTPVAFNDACAVRVSEALGSALLRRSRAQYSSENDSVRLVCTVGREFAKTGGSGFWFAFHPHQLEFLKGGARGFVAFGCGTPSVVLLIPFLEFETWLPNLNKTEIEDRSYWHVHIDRRGERFDLHQKEGKKRVDLTRFLLK